MYKTPQEAIQARIDKWSRYAALTVIEEHKQHVAEGLPVSPDYKPTPDNVTFEPDETSTWTSFAVTCFIGGKPAISMVFHKFLERCLDGMALELARVKAVSLDFADTMMRDSLRALADLPPEWVYHKTSWEANLDAAKKVYTELGEDADRHEMQIQQEEIDSDPD